MISVLEGNGAKNTHQAGCKFTRCLTFTIYCRSQILVSGLSHLSFQALQPQTSLVLQHIVTLPLTYRSNRLVYGTRRNFPQCGADDSLLPLAACCVYRTEMRPTFCAVAAYVLLSYCFSLALASVFTADVKNEAVTL